MKSSLPFAFHRYSKIRFYDISEILLKRLNNVLNNKAMDSIYFDMICKLIEASFNLINGCVCVCHTKYFSRTALHYLRIVCNYVLYILNQKMCFTRPWSSIDFSMI